MSDWPTRRLVNVMDTPTPRTDTERLDALEKWSRGTYAGAYLRGHEAVFGMSIGATETVWRPTLRAAIDAYLDAEQQSEQGK